MELSETLNPKRQTLNPKLENPKTLNPKPLNTQTPYEKAWVGAVEAARRWGLRMSSKLTLLVLRNA